MYKSIHSRNTIFFKHSVLDYGKLLLRLRGSVIYINLDSHIFGTMEDDLDDRFLINTSASKNCLCQSNIFQNYAKVSLKKNEKHG